jgi:N4-gp56 family major capsid protein
MGLQLTTNQTNQYQKHFAKRFLKTLKDTLVMEQFALKEPLPTGAGADTVRFFIEPEGAMSDVIALAEDTVENTTFSDNNLEELDVKLDFWGDKQKISNRLSLTSFFDRVKSSHRKMALSAALKFDYLMTAALVTAQDLAGHKRFAGGAANFAALQALAAANSAWTPILGLAAITQLKNKHVPKAQGEDYIHLVPPNISFDLVQHAKWEEPAKYAGAKQIMKGELGRLYGARYVEHTNPWIEDGAAGAEGTYAAAGNIYGVLTLGDEALGCVDLAGSGLSPYKPSMTILDKPDKSDPHNQFIVTAWQAYFKAAALSKKRFVVTRCKTTFA